MAKTVLITGANRGLGASLATAFSKQGFDLILCCRGKERPYVGDIHCDVIEGDLIKDGLVFSAILKLLEKKRIDILINNAGLYYCGNYLDTPFNIMRDIIDTNLLVPLKLTAMLWPHLSMNKGTVININSVAGRIGSSRELIYSVSKFGLTGFSKTLACDGKRDNVRVIDIPFGAMKTGMTCNRKDWNNYPETNEVADLVIDIYNNGPKNIKHAVIQGEIFDSLSL